MESNNRKSEERNNRRDKIQKIWKQPEGNKYIELYYGLCRYVIKHGNRINYKTEKFINDFYNDNKKSLEDMRICEIIEGLKMLKFPCEVELYSDSAYLVNGFSQGWIYNWQKNNWKTADKKPVKNKEIWQEIYNLTKIHKVKFIKVKGHADNEFNNRCDELARNAIKTL